MAQNDTKCKKTLHHLQSLLNETSNNHCIWYADATSTPQEDFSKLLKNVIFNAQYNDTYKNVKNSPK